MKKLFSVCFALLTGFVLCAQTTDVAVFEDITGTKPSDNDERTLKLVQEYFKSELATHSAIEIVQPRSLTMSDGEILAKYGFRRGTASAKEQIAKLCKENNAGYCAFVKIERNKDKGLTASVSVYSADGTLKKIMTRRFEEVRQADIAGIILARDVAVEIRGANPVDDLNLERMKKSLDSLSDDKIKKTIRKNMEAVK